MFFACVFVCVFCFVFFVCLFVFVLFCFVFFVIESLIFGITELQRDNIYLYGLTVASYLTTYLLIPYNIYDNLHYFFKHDTFYSGLSFNILKRVENRMG